MSRPRFPSAPPAFTGFRPLAEQAFQRSAGAPLLDGNAVRVLRDAAENYPAWEDAIRGASSTVHVEMYIIHLDDTGRRFVELLAARARAGVTVRLLYDWFGCGTAPLRGLFAPLVRAGGDVRVFNRPQFDTALGWLRRNHRKLITVDGRVAYVGGLCVGRMWEGRPERGQDPWRDTGVELLGPVLAHAERAFAENWRIAGGWIDPHALPRVDAIPPAGTVSLRLIPTEPFTAAVLRTDFLVTALARRSLWIADAYFLGHGPYIEALRLAARDGVDVRLLLPQGSDVGWTVPVSRTLYRVLLEAGVRIYEWNGAMMHAKTAVADSRWARVGSTNLNLNSWIGNWELDVAVEDSGVARTLEAQYEEDLARATEIVLSTRRARTAGRTSRRNGRPARRVLRTITGLGHSIGAAVTGNRPLEVFESAPILLVGALLVVFAAALAWLPVLVGRVLAAVVAWMGLSFIAESVNLWRRRPPP